jgi:hypothetical protein
MSSARWETKRWDAIVRELSSPEDSDAEDGLNVMSVCRNAHRVSEIARAFAPDTAAGPPTPPTPLMGMNSMNLIREGLAGSVQPQAASPPSAGTSSVAPTEPDDGSVAAPLGAVPHT